MKKALSLILAILLIVALVAGCSNQGNEGTAGTTTDPTKAPASSGTDDKVDDTPDAPTSSYVYEPYCDPNVSPDRLTDLQVVFEDLPSAKTIPLPLSDEKVEITAWMTFSSELYNSLEEMPVNIELERRTNVHVTYETGANTTSNEAFQLMIASNLYPDIIFQAESYIGGGDKAIDDGVYLRLNELIAEHAPNYSAMRSLSEEHLRGTVTDSGNMFGFRDLLVDPEPPWYGLTLRQDWLDDLGLETPETLADWETMMDAFMEKKGAEYGVCINPYYNRGNQGDEFITSFDVNYEFYQVDGVIKYGPIQDEFLEFLTFANEWYNKGYIDSEFFKYSNYGEYLQGDAYNQYGEGRVGAAQTMVLACGKQLLQNGLTTNEDMLISAVRNPVRNKGDVMHFRQVTSPVKASGGGGSAAISTQAEDPVLCTKWLDYRYTQDGVLLISYGPPGSNYSFDESTGVVTYTTEFVNYVDGMKKAYDYFIGMELINGQASVYSRVRGSMFTGADYEDNAAILAQDGYDYVIPVDVAFANAEDSAEYSAKFADIQTYVDEMTTKFINGNEPLDNFDDFVDTIKRMNIDTCIAIKQRALDAYFNRPLN